MFISFIGTWMQSVAQSWLVYRLTGSEWLLGLVGFAGQIPIFLLVPFGGVMADRYNRHRILMVTQTLSLLQALALALLTLTQHIQVGTVVGLAFTLGVINALDLPTRQSFLAELVGKDDLMNAIALNSSMVNGSRIVGPAIAGLLLAWLGEGMCFLINAISYVAVIAGLMMMTAVPRRDDQVKGSTWTALKEGFDYVRTTAPVRALLLLLALVSICGLPYIILMPIFADKILHGGASALGLMLGSAGIGSLAAALLLASRQQVQGLGRVVAFSVAAFGSLLIAFAFSHSLLLSTILLAPMGFSIMLQMSGSNTLLQAMVDDRLRGRMMSFFSMSLMGMAPFGSLLAGAIARWISAPKTLMMGGALCLGGALIFSLRLPHLRRSAIPLMPPEELTSNQ
ncbi:MAG: MFS transporter [Acidobacteria bacterium]|nr:MFS transporter [Acidobacteriota bacterium]